LPSLLPATAPAAARSSLYRQEKKAMAKLVYQVVQHDGGWAYKVGDVYSEAYRTHDEAAAAAHSAADKQQQGDETEVIEYQDRDGRWHTETARGDDRPETSVSE
jgi:hypothetical protein